MHCHIVSGVQKVQEDGLQLPFVLSDAVRDAGEVAGNLRNGLHGFVVGACEAEFVFKGVGRVEVVRHGGYVFLRGGARVEDRDVWAVDLRRC
jgi:hypothetical protein